MKPEEIIKMALEAGISIAMPAIDDIPEVWHITSTAELERFAALVAEAERKARQLAQAENEELKAQLARAGLDAQRAVLAEREKCIKALLGIANKDAGNPYKQALRIGVEAIRALGTP